MPSIQLRSTTIDYSTDWSEFKKWIDGTYASLRFTWIEETASYSVIAIDAGILRTVGINKIDPISDDQIDFETNFKNKSNVPFETLVSQKPYAYSKEITRFVGNLYECTNGTTNHDELLTKNIRLQGGYYWSKGANLGDRVSLSVIDKDNVLGYGTNFVVNKYVDRLPVAPWDHIQEISTTAAGSIISGLYLRLTYENTGNNSVNFAVTYRWFD
jgi:hypothetical protein